MILKVLSLNVWNTNPPVEDRQNRIAEYLSSHAPDVVALQEISPYHSTLQSDWIATQSGYQHVYYSRNGYWRGREEGLAILTNLDSSILLVCP
jgi:exonuclease III